MKLSRQQNGSLTTTVCTYFPGLSIMTEPFQRRINTDKSFTWYKTIWKKFLGIWYPAEVQAHTENTYFDFSVSSTALSFKSLQVCFLTQVRLSTLPGGAADVRLLSYSIFPDQLGFASPIIRASSNNPLYNDLILPVAGALANLTSMFATILGNAALYVGQTTGLTSKLILDKTFPFIKPHVDEIENSVNAKLGQLRDQYISHAANLKSRMDLMCSQADLFDPDRLATIIGSVNEGFLMDFLAGFGSRLIQIAQPIAAGSIVQYRGGSLIVDGRALATQGVSSRWVAYGGRYYDPQQIQNLLRGLYAQYGTRFEVLKARLCAFQPPQLNGFAALPARKANCDATYFRLSPAKVDGYTESDWWKQYSAFSVSGNKACHLSVNIQITGDRCLLPALECARKNLNNAVNGMPESAQSCTGSLLDGVRGLIQGSTCEATSTVLRSGS
ncbi:MAG: hypothetical protein EBX52_11400 [Proteobacteria bacterium]|nr:hypothetical protein [Pseudomonadota bacterium]